MTTFDSTGASIDSLGETRQKIADEVLSVLGADMAVDNEDSVVGKIITIAANLADRSNQGLQHAVAVRDPDTASGTGLRKLVKLNGITANESAFSTVALTVTSNAYGTVIQDGDKIHDPNDPDTLWSIDTGATLAPYSSASVSATCDVPGAIPALPGTLTKIKTPRQGWSTVTNPSAAAVGATAEADPALRQRRERAAKSYGKSTLYGIWKTLEDYDQTTDVFVHQNLRITADVFGTAPRSLRAYVRGGEDAIIAEILFRTAPIQTEGTTSYTYSHRGKAHTIKWFRPVDTAVDVAVVFRPLSATSPVAFPSWAESVVKSAIVSYFALNQKMSVDAIPSQIAAAVTNLVPGYYASASTVDGLSAIRTAAMGQAFTVALDDITVGHY